MVPTYVIVWDLPLHRIDGRPWFSPDVGAGLVAQFVDHDPGLRAARSSDLLAHWLEATEAVGLAGRFGHGALATVRLALDDGTIAGTAPSFDDVLDRRSGRVGR